jgi:ferredoxin
VSRLKKLTAREASRRRALAHGQVIPVPIRCIQCGICSYNCPVDIDVRYYARRGESVTDHRCILCGECVTRCPRATLRIEASADPVRPVLKDG